MKVIRGLIWDNERWRITVPGFFAGLVAPVVVQEGILRLDGWSLSFAMTALCGALLLIVGFSVSMMVKPPKKGGAPGDERVEHKGF